MTRCVLYHLRQDIPYLHGDADLPFQFQGSGFERASHLYGGESAKGQCFLVQLFYNGLQDVDL